MPPNNDLRSQVDHNFDRIIFRIQKEIPTEAVELERLAGVANEGVHGETPEEKALARQEYQDRRKELVDQLFKSAAKVLTDIQYQIFTAYFVLGMSEPQIAESFKVTQPYISIVLTAAIKKIRKHLKIK